MRRLTGSQLASYCARVGRIFPQACAVSLRRSSLEGVVVAKYLSSGPYSLAMLARMGHPYARRAPAPPMDPGVINAQSGRFRSAWRATPVRYDGRDLVATVENSSPEARWMHGTRRMIARPIEPLVAARCRGAHMQYAQEAVLLALRRAI